MRFAKIVFRIAGLYGLLVLIPPLFLESKIGRDYPPPITHPEFFYGFFAVAIAWQVLFLILGSDPVRYRPLMPAAMLEKIGYRVALIILYAQNRVTVPTLAIGSLDWIFLILFFIAYLKTRQ
ncbi:MAG: hypothetical protein ACRD59_14670 [Candidatus Acidiferrales bacterium]